MLGMRRRKRSRREQQAMFAKGLKPKRIVLTLDPAGDDRYLASSGTYMLDSNPDSLPERELAHIRENGISVGYVVREFTPGDKGPKHVASLKTADDVRRFLDDEAPGTFNANVESSRSKRIYVQQLYRMPNGDIKPVTLSPQKFA